MIARTLALCGVTSALLAQDAPKPRLELADSVRALPSARRVDTLPRRSGEEAPRTTRPVRVSFVRNQAILGLGLYGPAFAATVAPNSGVSASAAYLVMAGGSFFAAAELTRQTQITDGMNVFATRGALHGAAIGGALHYAMRKQGSIAGGIFFGSLLGTASAFTFARDFTPGDAKATFFGMEMAAITAATAIAVADPGREVQTQGPTPFGGTTTFYVSRENRISSRARAATVATAALVGAPLGAWYSRNAPYTVTDGDVTTLWTSTAIGALGASAFVARGDPSGNAVALTLLGGAFAGTVAGDRWLVRTRDHRRSDGGLMFAGATAGALMGAGISVLAGSSESYGPATAILMAAGAVGGIAMTERFLAPERDAGPPRRGARPTGGAAGFAD
ncbi:MAG: hypothetical protein K2X99_12985, partial [Gemmatimonadaceae bacterium]|nr:hypothetical protein [Gemmatimonadaceae bacterium]